MELSSSFGNSNHPLVNVCIPTYVGRVTWCHMWNAVSHKIVGEALMLDSKYKKKHIAIKDVVSLVVGEVVSTKKTHIVAKDVVGLQVGDGKNASLTKMKTY